MFLSPAISEVSAEQFENIGIVAEVNAYGYFVSLSAGDWNNDGLLDFATGDGSGAVRIYYNLDNFNFDNGKIITTVDSSAYGLHAVDIDGDNNEDIIVSSLYGYVYLLKNTGNDVFKKILLFRHSRFLPVGLATSDYDYDGDIDLIVGDNEGYLYYYRNDGNLVFTLTSVFAYLYFCAYGLTTNDFDNDGDNDLVVGDNNGFLTYIENVDGEFVVRKKISWGSGLYGVISADFDLDGDIDVIFSDLDAKVWYLDNLGDANFQGRKLIADLEYRSMATVGDFDGNGADDFLISTIRSSGSKAYGRVYAFKNLISPNVEPPVADAGEDKIACVGEIITFDGSNSYSSDLYVKIVNYTWDFGDGFVGYGEICTHSYAYAGTYTVKLTVTDSNGNTDTDKCIVRVGPDLYISSNDITFEYTTSGTNTTLNITANVSNIGAQNVTDVLIQVYNVSENDTMQIDSDIRKDIPSQSTVTVYFEWNNIPTNTTLHIKCIIDTFNEIDEANEYNNNATVDVTIGETGVIISVSGAVNTTFSSIYVTFSSVMVYGIENGWIELSTFADKKTVDMIYLCENEEYAVLSTYCLPSDVYTQIKMNITSVIGISKDTNEAIPIKIPNEEMIIFYNFTITDGSMIDITIHIDMSQSIIILDGVYQFIPYVEGITISTISFDMDISPNSMQLTPGDNGTYIIEINNTCNITSIYNVEFLPDTEINTSWYTITSKKVILTPYTKTIINITFSIPETFIFERDIVVNFTIICTTIYTKDTAVVLLSRSVSAKLEIISTYESKLRWAIRELENIYQSIDNKKIQKMILMAIDDLKDGLNAAYLENYEKSFEKVKHAIQHLNKIVFDGDVGYVVYILINAVQDKTYETLIKAEDIYSTRIVNMAWQHYERGLIFMDNDNSETEKYADAIEQFKHAMKIITDFST